MLTRNYVASDLCDLKARREGTKRTELTLYASQTNWNWINWLPVRLLCTFQFSSV